MRRFSIIIGTLAFALFGVTAAPRVHASAPAIATPNHAVVREITIPEGTPLHVRMNSTISSAAARVEQPVSATLVAPIRVGGVIVAPAGSEVNGYVSSVRRSGKVKGRASLGVRFTRLTIREASYPVAAGFSRIAPATKKHDAAKIGIPAAGGAVIGGLIGGKKGAAAGAGIGGGAGTAVVLTTRGKEVVVPRGAVTSVRLQRPVTVKVVV